MNIQEIRQKYPQYSDMSDGDLASALHRKYYADMPFAEFSSKIGLKQVAPARDAIGEAQTNPEVNIGGMKIQGETDGGFSPAAAIIGAGQIADKIKQGYQQANTFKDFAIKRLLGGGQAELDSLAAQRESETEKDRHFQKLQMIHPGSTTVGQIAAVAPTPIRALPVVAGMEYGDAGERAAKAGAAILGNRLVKAGASASKAAIEKKFAEKAATAVQDANVSAAKGAGYVALPSEVGGSMGGRIVEGLTGKIKAGQLASVKNQGTTDTLFRKAFGLSDEVPITLDTMKAVRAKAFEDGYVPVREFGGDKIRIKLDGEYAAKIESLTSRSDNASKAFGDVVKSDIANLVGGLKDAKPFTPAEGIDAIAILREKASDLFAKGSKTEAKAYKQAAEAIEGQIERFLTRSGKDGARMLKGYRDARQLMAKTFDGEKAINSGRDGMVNAQALAKVLKKSPGRLTGELRTIAEAASSMPQSTRLPQQGWSNPVTAVDSWGGTIATATAGNPLPFLLPAARVGGRYGLLSKPGQKMFATPSRDPSNLLMGTYGALNDPLAQRAGGLLGYLGQ